MREGRVLGTVVVRVLLQGQGKGCGARQSRGQDTHAPLPAPTGLHICLSLGRQSSEVLGAAPGKELSLLPGRKEGERSKPARAPEL